MRSLLNGTFILFGILCFLPAVLCQNKMDDTPFNERPAITIRPLKVVHNSGTVSIATSISNISDGNTGSFDFFIMADGTILSKQSLNLGPGEIKAISYEWKTPPEGEHNLRVVADPDEKLYESDRSDNSSEIDFSYFAGKFEVMKIAVDPVPATAMDLVIEQVSVQGHRFQENKKRIVTINFRVTNTSSSAETKSFRTEVDITSGPRYRKTNNISTNSIGPGKSVFISTTVLDAPATFDISIRTDADNSIAESNENNNTAQSYYKNPAPPVNRWISAGPDIITGVQNVGYPWSSAGGRLSAIAIDPNNTQVMYVGGQSAGIWKTTDGGANWFPLTDQVSVSVAAIALSPANAAQLFWVTANQGVFRSDDAGQSWVQVSMQDLNAVVHGGELLIHPADPNIMLVNSMDGLYRSQDAGATWNQVLSGAVSTGLEISNTRNRLYCAIAKSGVAASGVYESFDRGLTWRKLEGCPGGRLPDASDARRISLAISGSTMYAAFRTGTEFQLYRTTDLACSIGGVQESMWEKAWGTTSSFAELWSGMWMNPLNENCLYLGGTAFWRSTNKGSGFSKVSDYTGSPSGSAHADHHAFAVLPGQANTIFSLNDGGIYRSTNNGNPGSWVFIGKGISNVEFYDVADAFTNFELLIGGTQDNGVIRSDGSLEWKAKRAGDGATVEIDNSDANIMYSIGQYATSLQRSTNGGSGWSNMFAGLPGGAECFSMRYHIHPRSANILLASCNSLWRITDPGGTWQTIFTPADGIVTCSAVEPSGDIYLAATSRGKIFGGVNGNNFQERFGHPLQAKITDLELDPDNYSIMYLGCDGASSGRVFKLNRLPTGTYTSSDITGNLPQGVRVKCVAVDRMNAFTIYIGSARGVYRGRSFNNGQTWTWDAYMEGLPLADIRDLEVHPVSGVLTAGTYGRSIFEVSTGDPIGSVLAVEGRINFLRVHDVGTKFGPPHDVLDAEAIVQVDSKPGHYFGIKLRPGTTESSSESGVELLRTAFESNLPVRLEYVRNGLHSGRLIRVIIK